jgi:hypothetical protein
MAPAGNENLIQVHERAKLGCLPERTTAAIFRPNPFQGYHGFRSQKNDGK